MVKKEGKKVNRETSKKALKLPLYLVTILTLVSHCVLLLANDTVSTVHYSDGLIPLDYGKRPATDLFYEGNILLPDEADKLRREQPKFDLSKLDPDETTVLWKKKKPFLLDESLDSLPLEVEDPIWYTSTVPSRSGNFRFTIEQETSEGGVETFVIKDEREIDSKNHSKR